LCEELFHIEDKENPAIGLPVTHFPDEALKISAMPLSPALSQ
jgi:hypothetical protein